MMKQMQNHPKIIICTEKGKLEKYSILLCRSIREFGGLFSEAEIFSFAPRKGFEPKQSTLKEFERLGVIHQDIVLNQNYRAYPLANKPLVCAYFEENYPNEDVVFIDSDQIIFNQPDDFISSDDILLRPVDKKGVGFSSEEDSEYAYWGKLMKLLKFDFTLSTKVESSTGELIYPYFNSGLIITNTKFGLFKRWKDNFELIFDQGVLPEKGIFFLEQSLFTATILQLKMKYAQMNKAYNYPFSLHDAIKVEKRLDNLSNLVTAHYHDMLVEKEMPKFFSEFLSRTEKGKWLKTQIKELGIKPDSQLTKFSDKVKRKLLR